jgi:hypothetical protein
VSSFNTTLSSLLGSSSSASSSSEITSNDPDLATLANQLLIVVDRKVRRALGGLRIIVLPLEVELKTTVFGRPPGLDEKPNPAIYLNTLPVQKFAIKNLNSLMLDYGLQEVAEAKNTIVIRPNWRDNRVDTMGIILHEMAHAWAERCGFTNSEANAWLFEIQWVCTLATDVDHPLQQEMFAGLEQYFTDYGGRFDTRAKNYLKWTRKRLGLT